MPGDGPIPKRDAERRRRNKPQVPTSTAAGAADVEVPAADPSWHPIALRWYESLAQSGQSHWYEPSDWWTAQYIATAMSRNLAQGGKMSSVMFSAVLSGMTELLTTEGARRRARVELEKAEPEADPSVTALDDYRRNLA